MIIISLTIGTLQCDSNDCCSMVLLQLEDARRKWAIFFSVNWGRVNKVKNVLELKIVKLGHVHFSEFLA